MGDESKLVSKKYTLKKLLLLFLVGALIGVIVAYLLKMAGVLNFFDRGIIIS